MYSNIKVSSFSKRQKYSRRSKIISWCQNKLFHSSISHELLLMSRIFGTFPFNNKFGLSKYLIVHTLVVRVLEGSVLAFYKDTSNLEIIDVLRIVPSFICWLIVAITNCWHLYNSSNFILLHLTTERVKNECSEFQLIAIKYKCCKLLCFVVLLFIAHTDLGILGLRSATQLHIYSAHLCIVEQFEFFIKLNTRHLEKASVFKLTETIERAEYSGRVHDVILETYGFPVMMIITLNCMYIVILFYHNYLFGVSFIQIIYLVLLINITWSITGTATTYISQVGRNLSYLKMKVIIHEEFTVF